MKFLNLLGEPDYVREGHLYYRITETSLGNWPLKTKTMVIKLEDDKAIEWIKIHGISLNSYLIYSKKNFF